MSVDVQLPTRAVGAALDRLDGPQKVTGTATYAAEYAIEEVTYVAPVQSAVARGRVVSIDARSAQELTGVLAVLTNENAPRLVPTEDHDLAVLQSDAVAYYGQIVAAVVATTLAVARQAARLINVRYEQKPHDVELRADRTDLSRPQNVPDARTPLYPPDSVQGDVEAALADAPVTIDQVYTTPAQHNMPMEPRATQAIWDADGEGLTLYDSTSGVYWTQGDIAKAFGLAAERVRVIAPYVGGQFGSKGFTYPHVILTIMAAKAVARPAKLALTRQQMFALGGYRTPTIQHVQLGAGRDGTLTAISHDVVQQTAAIFEFTEKTAVVTRMMYAAPNRRTTHRLARLDLPVNSWMRAPGECPGMFALESAMDELAVAGGFDPIELRIRNEPAVDPETGLRFSSRGLVACLRKGADLFGWSKRDPRTRQRRNGPWLIGTGVAASTYPCFQFPATARVRADPAGRYDVYVAGADPGQGAWTALAQIAADALGVPVDMVHLKIGDSVLPRAFGAAGSSGTASWGSAIIVAAQELRRRLTDEFGGAVPPEGIEAGGAVQGSRGEDRRSRGEPRYAMHAFGAQFAEVRVHEETGEVGVPRLLGVFAAGRIINPKIARSQLLGGMSWGLSMALHEASVLDPRFGDFVNHDFSGYHIATNADVGNIEVTWIEEDDPHVNATGAKGIGEVGIVGTAAAIANAIYHAIGIRIRDLPITPDKVLLSLLSTADLS